MTKRKGGAEPLTAEEQVLKGVLEGKPRLRVHAHKIDDIAALLRLVDELKLRVSVEHAVDVNRPEIFAELRRRQIPVIYGPLESCPIALPPAFLQVEMIVSRLAAALARPGVRGNPHPAPRHPDHAAGVLAFRRVKRLAGMLLVPYTLWVAYVTILNTMKWRMHG